MNTNKPANSSKNQSRISMNLAILKSKKLNNEQRNEMLRDVKKQKNYELKKLKIKQEDNKLKEGEMWNRLSELNGEFKKINQSKKEIEKMSSKVL